MDPILSMVRPLIPKFVTAENLSKVYDSLIEGESSDGRRRVLLISKKSDGVVYGSIVVLDGNELVEVLSQAPLHELIGEICIG
ncbi:MAG: hypothetical protein K5867_04120 [Bacteroidales bacterium]|nr:hypothetical protein [Bacteroidales bacterium]